MPPERVVDLLGLDLELLGVRDHLPRRPGMVRHRLDAIGAGRHNLKYARLGIGALCLADLDPHRVAGDPALDEDDIAVVAGDSGATEGERVDGDGELVAAMRASGGATGLVHGHW